MREHTKQKFKKVRTQQYKTKEETLKKTHATPTFSKIPTYLEIPTKSSSTEQLQFRVLIEAKGSKHEVTFQCSNKIKLDGIKEIVAQLETHISCLSADVKLALQTNIQTLLLSYLNQDEIEGVVRWAEHLAIESRLIDQSDFV